MVEILSQFNRAVCICLVCNNTYTVGCVGMEEVHVCLAYSRASLNTKIFSNIIKTTVTNK